MMGSMLFFADEDEVPLPPREVRITEVKVNPLPDGRRVVLNVTLTPFLEYPNLEIVVYRPDGQEERSMSIIGTMDRHLQLTLHVARPEAGDYRAQIDLMHEGEILQTESLKFSIPAA
jgi:hypothetical protein